MIKTNGVRNMENCKEKVKESFERRMAAIRKLWKLYCENPDANDSDLGNLHEYGLGIDFVEAGTVKDQTEDYYRYQLSWGGPSEEFRLYKNGEVEFWYLDWFDGACVEVIGEDAQIIKQIIGIAFPEAENL